MADRISCQRLFGSKASMDILILSRKISALKFAFIITVDIMCIFTTIKTSANGLKKYWYRHRTLQYKVSPKA